MSQIQVGDTVTKLYGKKPALVENIWGSRATCRYLHGSCQSFSCYLSDLKIHEEEIEMTTQTKTLYSFKKENGELGYGTYLATNSAGQLIVEEKGTGVVKTFEKGELEEVLPYTFAVKINGKEIHYIGESGSVSKGDIVLIIEGTSSHVIGVVSAVDTKNKAARSKFKGVKLVTEKI